MKSLRKEVLLPHSPEDVWIALTDPRALAEWLMPNDFKAELGHKFRFQVDPFMGFPGITECEVLELDPPRRMSWLWLSVAQGGKKQPPPMNVAWTLAAEGGRAKLLLEHAGLEALPFLPRLCMKFSWGVMLKRSLPKVLGRVENGRFTPGAIPLSKRPYETKTLPPNIVR
jgi:uncharacterized protein YndB with AHSA1/START domain